MTKSELVVEGVNLMFIGMGFVMVFLLVLILAISFISNIINRYFPELPKPVALKPAPVISVPTNEADDLRPVIAAAIAHHRRKQGLN